MRIFRQLNYTDRLRIESMLRNGYSKKKIADVMRVNLSTIYRELKRGSYEAMKPNLEKVMRYSPDIAEEKYQTNLRAKGPELKIGKDHKLAAHIENKIQNEHYSPDAVLGEIRAKELKFSTSICKVTLYSYISKGVFLHLTNEKLPERGKRKNKYRVVRARRAPRGESIELRPKEVETREEFGHWEMDSVIGSKKTNSKNCLVVLTERKTRNELIFKVQDHSASEVVRCLDALQSKWGDLFSKIFKTITVDNGTEFADAAGMERCQTDPEQKRTKMYYCHPYSSYERGSNEVANRLIRRFVPKGTSLDDKTHEEIQWIEDWMNGYPRKILGYQCAQKLFEMEVNKLKTEINFAPAG